MMMSKNVKSNSKTQTHTRHTLTCDAVMMQDISLIITINVKTKLKEKKIYLKYNKIIVNVQNKIEWTHISAGFHSIFCTFLECIMSLRSSSFSSSSSSSSVYLYALLVIQNYLLTFLFSCFLSLKTRVSCVVYAWSASLCIAFCWTNRR